MLMIPTRPLKMMKSFWISLSLFLALVVGGCEKINDLLSGEMVPDGLIMLKQSLSLQRLLILSEKTANKGQAFECNLILTKNLQMAKELSQMPAKDYFKAVKSKEFEKNYHGLYKIFKFPVAPQAGNLPEQKLKLDSDNKYVGGYFFAKLQHPKGSNRIRIPSGPHVMVKFTREGMSLVTPDMMSEGEEALEDKLSMLPMGID